MRAADMHCDTIWEIYKDHKDGGHTSLRSNSLHLDLEKMRKGGYGFQNFAMFVHLGNTERPFECAMEMIDTFYQEMEANSDLIGAGGGRRVSGESGLPAGFLPSGSKDDDPDLEFSK